LPLNVGRGGLSRDRTHRLQAALFELNECKRLLHSAFRKAG